MSDDKITTVFFIISDIIFFIFNITETTMPGPVVTRLLIGSAIYIIVIIFVYLCYCDEQSKPTESIISKEMISKEMFVGKYDDTETDLLNIRLNEELNSPLKYMTTGDFNKMIAKIRKIVYDDIISYSKVCADMNGVDGPEPNQMTLKCNVDPDAMQEDIVNHVSLYVISYVKESHGVNLNPYQVTGDFRIHLRLLEDIIYPLMYNDLYTVHGIQYFDKNMLGEKVYFNLQIRDVLFTTLLRRGIEVLQDQDNQP